MVKTKKYRDGSVYRGEFKGSKRSIYGIQQWGDGRQYAGEFDEDTMTGRGVYSWPDGRRYEGGFINDIMTGHGIFWANEKDPKAKVQYGEFENSQLQGKGVQFKDDGNVLYIKVGKEWNMGDLINGFRIEISKDNQKASVKQCINNQQLDWVPKVELVKLEDKLKQLLEEKTKRMQEDGKAKELAAQLEEAQTQNKELQRQVESLQAQLSMKLELENELAKQLQVQVGLQEELEGKQQMVENKLKQKVKDQETEIQSLQQKITAYEEKLETIEKQKADLEKELDSIKDSHQYKRNMEMEEFKKQLEIFKKNADIGDTIQEKIKKLEDTLAEKQKIEQELIAQNQQYRQTIEETKNMLHAQQEKTKVIQQEVEQLRRRVKFGLSSPREDWQAVRQKILSGAKEKFVDGDIKRTPSQREVIQRDFRSVLKSPRFSSGKSNPN